MPARQRGLAERKRGGSGSRKTGLMVAFIPGAAEHFFWGLKVWALFVKGQVPGGCGTLLCRLCAAQFRGLRSLCRGDVPSVTLVCIGYLVRDDLGKTDI